MSVHSVIAHARDPARFVERASSLDGASRRTLTGLTLAPQFSIPHGFQQCPESHLQKSGRFRPKD